MTNSTPPNGGSRKRRKPKRNLAHAVTLRPAEIFEEYGIPPATLCGMCKHAEREKRLPSTLIPGRKGRKGIRLVRRTALEAFLKKFEC